MGQTAYILAARGGHLEVAMKLAELGLDVAAADNVSQQGTRFMFHLAE